MGDKKAFFHFLSLPRQCNIYLGTYVGFSNSLKTHLFHHNFDCKLFFGVKNGLCWKNRIKNGFIFAWIDLKKISKRTRNLHGKIVIFVHRTISWQETPFSMRFFFTSRESGLKNRLLAFSKLENAFLTLIQGSECFVLKRKLKNFNFLLQNHPSEGNFMRGIDCAHSRRVKTLPWPWFREAVCVYWNEIKSSFWF